MEENIAAVNVDMPNYSKIAGVKLVPEEFEKTPKKSIKRYMYQNS
jgi:long-chain acyl-CoA synthetase